MNVTRWIAIGVVVTAGVLAACGPGEESGSAEVATRPPVAVEVSPATVGELVQSIEVVGQLEPKSEATIKSEFTAVVSEVYVTEWVRVAEGQPLARLDTREGEAAVEAARAGVLQAEVGETRARRELERAVKLKEYGLVTQQALDDARTALEAAEASTAAARAQFRAYETRLEKAIIRAPIDGVVSFRGVSVGDRVENMGGDLAMFRVVDNRVLDLTVTVPSSKSWQVKVGQPIEFTSDAAPGRTFTGEVRYINPTMDQADRSVKVIAEVRNEDGALRGGMFAKGRIVTGSRSGALRIPRAALLSWDLERGVAEVFVVEADAAERRSVRTGESAGPLVEVVEGLAVGERVVTRGGFNLRTGDRVTVASGNEA
ncbi:MAG: efflux RND transporter periplasmic adaptor subunit [Acidobacteriota bacterium]